MKQASLIERMISAVCLAAVLLMTGVAVAEEGASQGERRWYRGNIHTHSFWSDGDHFPEAIAAWFYDQGYHFLSLTEHNVLADRERWLEITPGRTKAYESLQQRFPDWIDERVSEQKKEVRLRQFSEIAEKLNEDERFLMILAEEITGDHGRRPVHINVNNISELITPRPGQTLTETIQNSVDAVVAQRKRTGQPMMVHLNHPNFHYAVTAEDIMPVLGLKFMEVYNGISHCNNRGNDVHISTDRMWDIVLAHRLGRLGLPVMYGLATDDSHNYHQIPSRQHEPGRGWLMVNSPRLAVNELMQSIDEGNFYSSSGVELETVTASADGLSVKVLPRPGETYTISFIGTRRSTSLEGEPVLDDKGEPVQTTKRYSDQVGEVFHSVAGTEGEYRFQGDELYVRAHIVSSAPHHNPAEVGELQQAWVQPVVGPAALEASVSED